MRNLVDIIRIEYLKSQNFDELSLEKAIEKIARTGVYRNVERIDSMSAFMRSSGWERHGKSLFDFLTGLLDEEYHGVRLKQVGDTLLWKHGAEKKKK